MEKSAFEGYVPFGPEWEREMMKLNKTKIVSLFKASKAKAKWESVNSPPDYTEDMSYLVTDGEGCYTLGVFSEDGQLTTQIKFPGALLYQKIEKPKTV